MKVKKSILAASIIFLFSFHTYSQDWLDKIIPMQTKTSELSKILNIELPKQLNGDFTLKFGDGNLLIWFSEGNCVKGTWGAWDISKGTIISFTFYPKSERKPSFYKLSKKGAKEYFNQGHQIYTDSEKGLSFAVEFGKVRSITYTPPSKYDNLKCIKTTGDSIKS